MRLRRLISRLRFRLIYDNSAKKKGICVDRMIQLMICACLKPKTVECGTKIKSNNIVTPNRNYSVLVINFLMTVLALATTTASRIMIFTWKNEHKMFLSDYNIETNEMSLRNGV